MGNYLAFDLGASSGRAIVGILENGQLELNEIYRFPNYATRIIDSLYWNMLNLYEEILNGLKKYNERFNTPIEGIGIDTWGVDFVLLDEKDRPIGYNYHYRDNRTEGMLEEALKVVSQKEFFNRTGIQFMRINSSIQLFSMKFSEDPQLKIAKTLLMVPDFLHFLLSGKKIAEYSIASTTQLIDPFRRNWAFDVIEKLGFDSSLFYEIKQPGTILGKLQDYICKEVGFSVAPEVIAPASHDTASAVAAIPMDLTKFNRDETAYISSGTWSLVGVELTQPFVNEKAMKYNFTNEGGVDGTIRFLKNITGMWFLQECKRIWDKALPSLTWEQINGEIENINSINTFINPDDSAFLNPDNMISEIEKYCRSRSQPAPNSIGEFGRCILESLACKYKDIISQLEDILESKIKILHIIGGGSENSLLNQLASNILEIPVISGPKEATTIGNLLIQAKAKGEVKDLEELRRIVKNSFPTSVFKPEGSEYWKDIYQKYVQITKA